jgi:hypothetical protein
LLIVKKIRYLSLDYFLEPISARETPKSFAMAVHFSRLSSENYCPETL